MESTSLTAELPAERLLVQNRVGTITIRSDPTATEITAEAVMIGRGHTQELADIAVTEIVVDLERSSTDRQTIEAFVDHPKPGHRKNYTVNWVITAPADIQVDVINDVGDVTVLGFHKAVSVKNDVGEVECRQNTAGTTIQVDVGDVIVEGAAPIEVRTDVGDVSATVMGQSSGAIAIRTDVGGVELWLPRDFAASVQAVTDVGSIKTKMAQGTMSKVQSANRRFNAEINGGGQRIELATDVGNIAIATVPVN